MEQTLVTNKKPWTSRTLWVNVMSIGGAMAAAVFGVDLGLTPEIQNALLMGGVAAVNIVLRLLTKAPIKLT